MAGDDLRGRRLGGFELIEPIGEGSFGSVWRARQVRLDRDVAVKVLDPLVARDPTAARRFEREGRSAASLDHPAIVPVYEAGDDDGLYYLAMRLVDGETFAGVIDREAPIPHEAVIDVLAPIANALDAAHAAGLVHRDVKPANILIERGRPYLSDFGIAASARELGRYTTGSIGTAEYMSPEQARGDEVDHRSDLYALGCVAFHALTGRSPFARDDVVATLLAHTADPVPPTGDLALDSFFATALAKDPDDRFESGAEFMAAFGGRIDDVSSLGYDNRRRRRMAGLFAAVGAVAFGATALVVVTDGDDAGAPGATATPVPTDGVITTSGEPVGDDDVIETGGPESTTPDASTPDSSAPDSGAPETTVADDPAPALQAGGRVRVGATLDLTDPNPHSSLDTSKVLSEWVLPVMYRVDEDLEPVPSLATGPPTPTEGDPLLLTWEIHGDRVWDDGTPVTTADIVATFDYLSAPDTNALSLFLYDDVVDVTAVSDTELQIALSEPNGAAHFMFSTIHPIIQSAAFTAHVADGGSAATFLDEGVDFAAGPYRVATGRQNPGEIELVPNAAYDGENRPALESVEVASYPSSLSLVEAQGRGEVDLVWVEDVAGDEFREVQALANTTTQVSSSTVATQMTFNFDTPVLQDVRVREAIAIAIDRAAIADSNVGRKIDDVVDPWNSLVFAPGQRDDSRPFEAYREADPDRARELLASAGYTRPDGEAVVVRNEAGEDFPELIIALLSDSDSVNTATIVVPALNDIGIQARALPAGTDVQNERINTGDFDLLFQFRIFNNDPIATQFSFASSECPATIEGCSGDGVNVGAFADPTVDELLATAEATIDPDARLDVYEQIDQRLFEQLPAVPLYVDPAFTAYDDDIVGVVMAPNIGPLVSLGDWALRSG